MCGAGSGVGGGFNQGVECVGQGVEWVVGLTREWSGWGFKGGGGVE